MIWLYVMRAIASDATMDARMFGWHKICLTGLPTDRSIACIARTDLELALHVLAHNTRGAFHGLALLSQNTVEVNLRVRMATSAAHSTTVLMKYRDISTGVCGMTVTTDA